MRIAVEPVGGESFAESLRRLSGNAKGKSEKFEPFAVCWFVGLLVLGYYSARV